MHTLLYCMYISCSLQLAMCKHAVSSYIHIIIVTCIHTSIRILYFLRYAVLAIEFFNGQATWRNDTIITKAERLSCLDYGSCCWIAIYLECKYVIGALPVSRCLINTKYLNIFHIKTMLTSYCLNTFMHSQTVLSEVID